MAECSECGKQTMSFTCHYCGKKFCSEHRLPENHDCEGLDTGKKDEYMKSTSDSSNQKKDQESQKWFKEKKPKKETRRPHRQTSNTPRILTDIKDTLKRNYTLSIIGFTSIVFVLTGLIPGLANLLALFPAITQQAAAQAGYGVTLLTQPWAILTVMIVHGGLFHLLANMITFYFFGGALEKSIGSKDMLKFYIGTGLLASIGYILFSNLLYLIHGAQLASGLPTLSPAVGASGAVVAAVGAVSELYPKAEVLLYFIIPMKIRTAVGVFGAIELVNLAAKIGGVSLPVIGGFASSAHLTGLVAGIWFGRRMKRKISRTGRINIFQ